ncbi:protoporphyrinogen oxidase [Acidicapsa ligni]|uniref:protoporphyrinogen oxidase n=1 Tax=Acidicapsa ligni TaxID=542300 RepID=UPI0021DF6520|nr:protoporphyrinogen oxidase [Acidicapsa ligni]
MRIAIIGGGIAGLSAAYDLAQAKQAGAAVEYELYEADSRLGGVLSSEAIDGTVLEHGPDSFLTEKPAAAQLCRELGLEADLISSNDASRKTFILVRNRLVALPDGLMFLIPTKLIPTALTGLFSLGTKLRMARELLLQPKSHSEDESVAALVKRHYGQETVDRLADPLLSGIYGGDASQLSAQSVLPRLVEMEARYGSLTRAMLAGRRAMRAAQGKSGGAKPIFTTLRHGLQQMVDAMTARLESDRLHVKSPIVAVEREGDGWLVKSLDRSERFDAVIVATPAWASAILLKPIDRELGRELGEIPYTSSITVNLVYDEVELGRLPKGFGFLVPAVEKRALLACTFVHRKFSGRTAPGKAVLRAFLGGAHNEELLAESDEALGNLVREELRQILSITAVPELVQVRRWRRAMAQYAVGHKARLRRIRVRLDELPGLHLVGNAYDGIGISDCIRLGRQAATELVAACENYAPR